eukprot:TRINITY_DN19298_c0_g1_i1.p1 TRINITY_DN19298_c0_g1~~TRINITY_DN19298_c0_g1_i1.p1  ORF type:complete len:278 (-),score=10.87 TRINITY_DN19298_c0_g1_i1:476-1309(-)
MRNGKAAAPFLPPAATLTLAVTVTGLLAALTATAVVMPTDGGRYVTVGATSTKFNYEWNPRTDMAAWAAKSTNKIYAGDVLVFNYPENSDELWQFADIDSYNSCNYAKARRVCSDKDGAVGCNLLVQAGQLLLASGMIARCTYKAKLNVTVATRLGPKQVLVGEATGAYTYPWNQAVNYTQWLNKTKIYEGDSLVFKYDVGKDEVYVVPTQADYDACDVRNYVAFCSDTDGANAGCISAPLVANTTTYFVSGVYSHCAINGQKIAVTPLPANATSTS